MAVSIHFSGIKTFIGLLLSSEQDLVDADVAILGAPYDGGTSFRPGGKVRTRKRSKKYEFFGTRSPSTHDVHIFKSMKVGDDDCPVTPQDIEKTHGQIKDRVTQLLEASTISIVVGGDHSTTIGSIDAVVGKVRSRGYHSL